MLVKEVQEGKITQVEINYGYDSSEWTFIRVHFEDGQAIEVRREQIEAFIRMEKVLEDLNQVEKLRDQLANIFRIREKIKTS